MAVVAENVLHALFIEVAKQFDNGVSRDPLEIPTISPFSRALIGRVHVDDVVLPHIRKHFPKIAGPHLTPSL